MLKQATGLLDRTAIIDSSASLADANAMACLGLALNEPERAAAVLDAAEKLESVSPTAPTTSAMYHNLRGTALTLLGSDQDAMSAFRKALAVLGSNGEDVLDQGHRALVTSHVYHNLGCCQAFVASDTDSAVTTWRTALDLLRQSKTGDDDAAVNADQRRRQQISEAELLCNVGQIEINASDSDVRETGIASLAQALETLGETYDVGHVRTARVLALLARGYHLDGKAVSSEGLYRSALGALEEPSATEVPSLVRQRISTLRGYAALLEDWEQREGDSKVQIEIADALEEQSRDAGGVAFPLSMCLPELV